MEDREANIEVVILGVESGEVEVSTDACVVCLNEMSGMESALRKESIVCRKSRMPLMMNLLEALVEVVMVVAND